MVTFTHSASAAQDFPTSDRSVGFREGRGLSRAGVQARRGTVARDERGRGWGPDVQGLECQPKC